MIPSNTIQKSRSIFKDETRFLELFWKAKSHLKAEFHKTDLDIWSYSRAGKIMFLAK